MRRGVVAAFVKSVHRSVTGPAFLGMLFCLSRVTSSPRGLWNYIMLFYRRRKWQCHITALLL